MVRSKTGGEKLAWVPWVLGPVLGVGGAIALVALFWWLFGLLPIWGQMLLVVAGFGAMGIGGAVRLFCALLER